MNRRRYAYLSTLVLLATSPFPAFATTDTYTGLDGGFWNNAANWDNGIPQNTLAQTFDVQINSLSPQTVQLNTNATINTLTLAAPATLAFLPGNTLTLAAGSITNAGTLLINGTGSASSLLLATNSTLTGAGTLLLTGPSSQISGTTGARLTTDNLITGQGSLGLSKLKFTNSGTIIASAGSLTISPVNASDGFINTGTLRADGGKLILGNSTYTNTGGTIEALDGSTVQISGSVIGGTIRGLSGTVTFPSSATLSSVNLAGTISTFASLDFNGVSTNSGALQASNGMTLNNATINNTGTISGQLFSSNVASLTGGGTAFLGQGNSTLTTLFSDNTITTANVGGSAAGLIATTITNTGIIRADANTLVVNASVNNVGGVVEAINGAVNTVKGSISGGTLRGNGGILFLSAVTVTSATLEGTITAQSGTTFLNTLVNNGTVTISSGISISIPSDITISGTGNMLLSGNTIQNTQSPGISRLTNYSTISGSGNFGQLQLSNSQVKIVNYGTIAATTGGMNLNLANSTDAFYNFGTLMANGQQLSISGSSVIDSGGTIEALNANTVIGSIGIPFAKPILLTGTTLSANNGTITLEDNSFATQITMQNVTMATINGQIMIQGQTTVNLNGTISLSGSLTLISSSSNFNLNGTFNNMGVVSGAFSIAGDSALLGGGTLTEIGISSTSGNHRLVTDNTLMGNGNLGNGTLRITNTGLITTFSGFGGSLTIAPTNATDGFNNQGILCANGVPLYLAPSVYTNTTGTIEALNGSLVIINGTVNGGTLLSNGLINVNTSSSVGPISGSGTVSIAAGMTLISDALTLNTLQVNGTHILRTNTSWSGTSQLSSLVIAADTASNYTGQLDLNNNALILLNADTTSKATTRSTLINQIASGKNGGQWTGTGITSSTVASDQSATGQHLTTLALIDNAELGATTFRGQSGLDANSLIITQALLGDVDLSGKVDFGDLLKVAQNFGKPGGWAAGNMEGPDNGGTDTTVDFGDLLLVAQHFGQTLPLLPNSNLSPQSSSLPATPVPEPASLLLLTLSLPTLLARRRLSKNHPITPAQ